MSEERQNSVTFKKKDGFSESSSKLLTFDPVLE